MKVTKNRERRISSRELDEIYRKHEKEVGHLGNKIGKLRDENRRLQRDKMNLKSTINAIESIQDIRTRKLEDDYEREIKWLGNMIYMLRKQIAELESGFLAENF